MIFISSRSETGATISASSSNARMRAAVASDAFSSSARKSPAPYAVNSNTGIRDVPRSPIRKYAAHPNAPPAPAPAPPQPAPPTRNLELEQAEKEAAALAACRDKLPNAGPGK